MATLSPIPALQDLKTTLEECTLIFPSQDTQKRSFYLSNKDQCMNYDVLTAHFFSPNPDFPPKNVSKVLKMALEKVLVPYDFMAGRLKLNHKTGCLEIDCNVAGAGFVVASSEFSLGEIKEFLPYPNLGFQQLATRRLDHLGPEVDQPLCIFQISEGAKRVTDEYVKSVFDWLELHRGISHGDYKVSSWLKLGFDQVVYPWGKPLYSCPVVDSHRKDVCWIFPNALDGGISAMVSLPHQEMVTFEAFFHKIFAGIID
ncbi:hypothetical protein BUALT_Bualt02G0142000 [Buddleja alternifolia]|uniref:Uncharacterized protein n=1 Tax=Buddleja alternifolia TaxID=168488 RepID=A0AAV6Y058_9LAMI|nr:hypothetical protein BUALT_Bualt02G0142000 [Buddleja alternifolia]